MFCLYLRNLALPALLQHIEQMTGLTSSQEVLKICKEVEYYLETLDVFESAIHENTTLQDVLVQYGIDVDHPGREFMSSHCQELGQQARWLLIG